MGCDIHSYIEFRKFSDIDKQWSNFGGRINPGRHYGIFAKLVGVRNYDDYHIVPLSEPRGLPENVSWIVEDDNTLYIVDEKTDEEGRCSRGNAELWVKAGSSKIIDDKRVTHPDWHSHSWATVKELEQVFADEKVQFEFENEPEWVALLDCLKSFERQGFEARLVFWFDN